MATKLELADFVQLTRDMSLTYTRDKPTTALAVQITEADLTNAESVKMFVDLFGFEPEAGDWLSIQTRFKDGT